MKAKIVYGVGVGLLIVALCVLGWFQISGMSIKDKDNVVNTDTVMVDSTMVCGIDSLVVDSVASEL